MWESTAATDLPLVVYAWLFARTFFVAWQCRLHIRLYGDAEVDVARLRLEHKRQ